MVLAGRVSLALIIQYSLLWKKKHLSINTPFSGSHELIILSAIDHDSTLLQTAERFEKRWHPGIVLHGTLQLVDP
jgi:hypothetical protein